MVITMEICVHFVGRNPPITICVSEARKGMEAVAEHINEMQKIYEEYGTIFDELSKMFKDLYPHKTVSLQSYTTKLKSELFV